MLKKKKVYKQCSICNKDLTGKIQKTEIGEICFKCFVPYRQKLELDKKLKKENEVIDRIRLKKYWCPVCDEKKNDNEVRFGLGVVCLKCGLRLDKILYNKLQEKKREKEYYKKWILDNL